MIGATTLGKVELAIARSVLYAGLFEYPLSLAQLRQTLIECSQTPSQILGAYQRSDALRAIVGHADGYFFPRGREEWIAQRRRRERRSREFLHRHGRLLACICALPYVRMVALSGSIAHLNLDRDGDLDLFIVTRGPRAWSVTVAAIVLARLAGRRRIVCANFTVSDAHLTFEPQDLFTASQIIHLRPLIGHDVFQRLLAQNSFVSRFYPNFHDAAWDSVALRLPAGLRLAKRAAEWVCAAPSAVVERACRAAFGWHLRRRSSTWRSPEQVTLTPECLKLHTRSHRRDVLDRFERSVRNAVADAELMVL
jgi:hypothetical protein